MGRPSLHHTLHQAQFSGQGGCRNIELHSGSFTLQILALEELEPK